MRVNTNYIFIFLSVVLIGSLSAIPAIAQNENDPASAEFKDISSTLEGSINNEDKPLIVEHDRSSRYRDSTHTKSVAPSPVVNRVKSTEQAKPSSANKEDDALSFNFLFYIIQKFKISDLVDE